MENTFFISNYDFTLHFVACAAQLLSFVALVLCAEHVYIQPYYYYYYYYYTVFWCCKGDLLKWGKKKKSESAPSQSVQIKEWLQ